MRCLITALFILISINSYSQHRVLATYYNPTRKQCDKTPLITADGSKINTVALRKGRIRWVALSRDMLRYYKYGDAIVVKSDDTRLNGIWHVKDTMNPRHKRRIDFLTHEKNFLRKPKYVIIKKSR